MVAIEVSCRSSKRGTCHPGNMRDNYLTASHLVNQENQLPREPQNSKLIILINRAHCNYFPSFPPGFSHQLVVTLANQISLQTCFVLLQRWKSGRSQNGDVRHPRCSAASQSFTVTLLLPAEAAVGRTLAGLGPECSEEPPPFVSDSEAVLS